MKQLLKGILIVSALLCFFSVNVLAIDYVGVNAGSKRGKYSKTADPVFASVTATTQNYIVSGDIRVTSLYVTTNATIPALTFTTATGTTASITNLGKALNGGGFAVSNVSQITAATLNAGTDIISPTAYLTTVLSTLTNTTRVISEQPLTFGASCPTAAMTVSGVASFNYSIPVTINGALFKLPLIK